MCSARCADLADGISDQAQLVVEVLGAYVAEFGSINSMLRITDVAKGIADRIERSTAPAPFTFGDLATAARVIRDYTDEPGWSADLPYRDQLRALADRLSDAADVDPNP